MFTPPSLSRLRFLAADFDGTNDYASRAALSGLSDGKQGTFSAWVRLDGGDGSNLGILVISSGRCYVYRDSTNKFTVIGTKFDTSDDNLVISTSNSYTAGATWLNVLASWNMATPGARHIYINDASDLVETSFIDEAIDYTGNGAVGATNNTGTNKMNGCLAEVFFHDTYLDLSVEANRRKFISSAGRPVDLGQIGEVPLGAQPRVYLSLRNAPASGLATNRGSGGDYTITGTLDMASTSPSG